MYFSVKGEGKGREMKRKANNDNERSTNPYLPLSLLSFDNDDDSYQKYTAWVK